MEGGGFRGHILNCGKTATNTCIIILRLSLAKLSDHHSGGNVTCTQAAVDRLSFVLCRGLFLDGVATIHDLNSIFSIERRNTARCIAV